jgi:hypothetical protein
MTLSCGQNNRGVYGNFNHEILPHVYHSCTQKIHRDRDRDF